MIRIYISGFCSTIRVLIIAIYCLFLTFILVPLIPLWWNKSIQEFMINLGEVVKEL